MCDNWHSLDEERSDGVCLFFLIHQRLRANKLCTILDWSFNAGFSRWPWLSRMLWPIIAAITSISILINSYVHWPQPKQTEMDTIMNSWLIQLPQCGQLKSRLLRFCYHVSTFKNTTFVLKCFERDQLWLKQPYSRLLFCFRFIHIDPRFVIRYTRVLKPRHCIF